MRQKTKSKPYAFSLVELLTGIAVIAILASVIFAVFGSVSNKATLTKCTSNLRQFHSGIMLYAGDNNGTLPIGHRTHGRSSGSWHDVWQYTLWEYMDFRAEEKNGDNLFRFFEIYGCPMGDTSHINYAISDALTRDNYRLSTLEQPSRNMLMVTHYGNSRASMGGVSNPSWQPPGGPSGGWNFWYDEHANVLFLDGLVEQISYDAISTISSDSDDAFWGANPNGQTKLMR